MSEHGKVPVENRRSFLAWILGGSLGAFVLSILYPLARYLVPPVSAEPKPTTVEAAKVDELAPNSGKIFRFGTKPGILINTPEGKLKAFTAVCTHLDCTVQYRPDLEHIWCACHNGHYDQNGMNIAGPPPRPLTPYRVNVKGDQVFVSKEA